MHTNAVTNKATRLIIGFGARIDAMRIGEERSSGLPDRCSP